MAPPTRSQVSGAYMFLDEEVALVGARVELPRNRRQDRLRNLEKTGKIGCEDRTRPGVRHSSGLLRHLKKGRD